MPDYAEPIPASEVCTRIADTLKHNAERLRYDAALLLARADAMDAAVNVAEDDAARYAKWQETPQEKP